MLILFLPGTTAQRDVRIAGYINLIHFASHMKTIELISERYSSSGNPTRTLSSIPTFSLWTFFRCQFLHTLGDIDCSSLLHYILEPVNAILPAYIGLSFSEIHKLNFVWF